MERVEIGCIDKTKTCRTVIRITDFKGQKMIDIRDWFQPKGSAEFFPTKKGICLGIGKISEVIGLLEKAEQTLVV